MNKENAMIVIGHRVFSFAYSELVASGVAINQIINGF